jgi:hypothetical protein
MLAALAVAAGAVALAVTRLGGPARPAPAAVAASLPARPASYLGVYATGAPASYGQVASFAQAAGRQPTLVGYFSGWAQPFAAGFAGTVRARGGVPLVQIDPSYASVAAIAAGSYDPYLRSYADSVRGYGHPVVIGFGHEMNAPWYSWGYRHVPASVFVRAWRHVVDVFRGQGARNVTWLWTINATLRSTGPARSWWPGASYVSWVGIDGYFYRPADTFTRVFTRTIDQVRSFTSRPVLLAETAVGPRAGQAAKIAALFAGVARSRLLGLVWFDNAQHDGIYHQDWKIQDSPAAQAAFRAAVRATLVTKVGK